MIQRVLMTGALVAVVVAAGGCATKKFVREEIGKTEGKTAQEVGRLDTEIGQERTRLTGVSGQVTEARQIGEEATRRADEAAGRAGAAAGKAEEAGREATAAAARAEEAGGAARQALTKAEETDGRLTRLWSGRHKRTPAETIVVQFGFDRWQLDDRAQTALLEVVKQLEANPNLVVDLEGYTDSVGAGAYNVQLSERRAEAVRRFLVEKGVDLHRINAIGLGDLRPVADNKTRQGRDQNRRVSVKLSALAE